MRLETVNSVFLDLMKDSSPEATKTFLTEISVLVIVSNVVFVDLLDALKVCVLVDVDVLLPMVALVPLLDGFGMRLTLVEVVSLTTGF